MYSSDDPDVQVETLNKLITDCLSRHAPIKRTKFTRPPAPWMKTLNIINLQKKINELRSMVQRTQTESGWELFRNTRNELKYKIKCKDKCKNNILQKVTGVEKFKNNL